MIQEAKSRTYRAVLCKHCREPIPVPAIVIRIESLSEPDQSEAGQSERVFTLRCRACVCEHPYRSREILEIEGEPKGRRISGQTIYRHGALTRAASA
jgi:hypothetical protein